jgi:hypothetical protein
MRTSALILVLCSIALSVPALAAKPRLTAEVLRRVPEKYDINAKKYRHAKEELEDLVESCGPGVVEGAVSRTGEALENRCTFQVKLDDLFFKPLKEKTGLLPDTEWAFQDGVSFFEPNQVASVPDNFDLRDLMKNGQPDLRTQKCGDCWAWATHHGLELARAVHDEKAVDHSIQAVLSCSKAGSCGGGYMSAVDFLKNGLPYEPDFPYLNGTTGTCKFSASQIQTGWDGKTAGTPYVGNSLMHSRAKQLPDGSFREGSKVESMMAAMYQWKSPLVVTVAAYSISGNGIYNSCSSINSGGNHMVAIVGWEMVDGKRIAHVWNSWGHSHGEKGVSRIQWECGDGKLNRGLGQSAKIVQYHPPCTPPDASQVYMQEIQSGQSVQIGVEQKAGATCSWLPTEGLADPNACVTAASPKRTTEYHLQVSNACGKSSSMTLVYVWGASREGKKDMVYTPFGEVPYRP